MDKVAKIKYIEELLNELKDEITEELNTKEGERLKELGENPITERMNQGVAADYDELNVDDCIPCRDKFPFKCLIVGVVVAVIVSVVWLTL